MAPAWSDPRWGGASRMFDAKRASMLASLIFGAASWFISQVGLAHAGEQGPVVFKEEGKASYYGDEFQGQKTATGERFDQNQLTAAHPTLPLGSEVTVTNPDNGRKVDVEVNDRGPYVDG